jgi:D-tyrosyl-tRNA(Tyr) deacylase
LVLLGIETEDTREDADWLIRKILNMRILADENGVMNKSVLDLEQEILVVSQFTLHASTKKGNRPSYIKSARPEHAEPLYEYVVNQFRSISNLKVEQGRFGAHMDISFINDGPVTILLDSKRPE